MLGVHLFAEWRGRLLAVASQAKQSDEDVVRRPARAIAEQVLRRWCSFLTRARDSRHVASIRWCIGSKNPARRWEGRGCIAEARTTMEPSTRCVSTAC